MQNGSQRRSNRIIGVGCRLTGANLYSFVTTPLDYAGEADAYFTCNVAANRAEQVNYLVLSGRWRDVVDKLDKNHKFNTSPR